MRTRHALWAAALAASFGACTADAPGVDAAARPRAARPAPTVERTGPASPGGAEVAAIPGGDLLLSLGGSLAESVFGKLLESSGLFDWLGLGGPDEWTKAKLEEIVAKLDHLDGDIAALAAQLQEIESLLRTLPAREAVEGAQVRFGTCYRDRLRPPAAGVAPEDVAEYNRARLARAYQVVGLPPPAGLILLDDDCAVLEKLNGLQSAILPRAPGASRPLVELAKLARLNGEPFDRVGAWFAYVVSVERQGMTILAQAHHRLGKDAELAVIAARFDANLQGQAIELLHAAEAYVAYQSTGDPYAPDALALADLLASRIEGKTRFVTSSRLAIRPWLPGYGAPDMAQGGQPVPLDDDLVAEEGILPASDAGAYGRWRTSLVYPEDAPYPYVITLPESSQGVELGRASHVSIVRSRSTDVAPSPPVVSFAEFSFPFPITREVQLEIRNAVTLDVESLALDRALLAHSAGLASAMARFHLLPTAEDPRRVTLAVDEPAWGLTDVAIGGSGPFLARVGLGAATLELVPAGPEEPDRYALRLDDGWLGIELPASVDPAQPEPFALVQKTAEPFYFDLVRAGDAYEVSHLGADGIRRHLYVNEQVMSGIDWRANPQPPSQVDLTQMAYVFSEGDPTNYCPSPYGQPDSRLSVEIRGGNERAATYWLRGGALNWIGGSLESTTCYLTNVTANTTETLFRCYASGTCTVEVTDSDIFLGWGLRREVLPGHVHRFWCEQSSFGRCWDFRTTGGILLSVQ